MQERTSKKEREDQIEQGRPPLTEYDAELEHTYGKPDDGTRDPSMEDRQERRGESTGDRPEDAPDSGTSPVENEDER